MMIGLKSRTKLGILLSILLFSIIVHDIWPYSEREYETQNGLFNSHVSFDLDSGYLNIISVNLFNMIVEPSYQIDRAFLLSSNFDNVTLHVLLTNGPDVYLFDEYSDLTGIFYNDTSLSFYNLSSEGHTLEIQI